MTAVAPTALLEVDPEQTVPDRRAVTFLALAVSYSIDIVNRGDIVGRPAYDRRFEITRDFQGETR